MPKEKSAKSKKEAEKSKSLESRIWDAACSIRRAKDAPKYKHYILPLIFTNRLCNVFDDEVEARTTAIDHLEAELDRQITRFNRLRQSTLSSAFSGKLTEHAN